ncbi:MAG TPA: carboxypeptidase regulatory-like domain-containing protein [Planctomycetes bacterium]|nr:carboxypeptidase regulatory-like domain-containing protein [Planctomycetota bacterium]
MWTHIPAGGPLFQTHTTSGLDGVFELEVPIALPDGTPCNLQVTQPPRSVLYSGPVTLRDDFIVLVPSPVFLHGHVLGISPDRVSAVRIDEDHAGDPRFLGSSPVDGSGAFRCAVSAPSLPPSLQCTVLLEGATNYRVAVGTPDLTSPDGAEIPVPLSDIMLLVTTADGSPLEGARVAGGDSEQRCFFRVETGADGYAQAEVLDGKVILCASADGYGPVVESFDARPDARWTIALPSLEEEDSVSGQVIFSDGRPAEGAFVSATPVTGLPNIATDAMRSAITDETGHFEIKVGGRARFVLTAYLRSYGLSAPQAATSGVSDLTIRIPDYGSLDISMGPCPPSDASRAGVVEFVFANVDTLYEDSGHTTSLPIHIEEMDPGVYNVYVWEQNEDRYASGTVEVIPGETGDYSLPCQTAWFVEGRVVNGSGQPVEGCVVRSVVREWPTEAVNRWGSCQTDGQGRFKLLVPSRETVPLSVSRQGSVLLRSEGNPDTQVTLRIPGEDG